ncbi:MAG: DUF4105 domain-containing protein [Chitinophagaceae bacterium]|nr:DUF4105 domain-containing protein [Chitinophagaceae bacterium]
MVQKFLISYLLFLTSFFTFAQSDSCRLRISLLTGSPGEELYSTFGHSAIRVTDTISNEDIVYNYGTFDFGEPGFYTKFVRGKLMYYLSTENFSSFKQSFQQENRGLTEQVLNLSCIEKLKITTLLQQNLMGANKFYKYDFLFDNCTTRLRDLLEKAVSTPVHFMPVVNKPTTFRQHIFEYMDYNNNQWTKLGMDILLGNKTDAAMNNREAMFLPDYLFKGFDSAKIGNKPVVESKTVAVDLPTQNPSASSPKGVLWTGQKSFLTHPAFIFWVLLIAIVVMSFSKSEGAKKLLYGFDGFLFFITGFAGILMLFMWFGTDHIVCRNNYNLLWAWPTHAIAAFFIHRKKGWTQKYFFIAAIFYAILLCTMAFLPQPMNKVLAPIILLLIFRSIANGK